MRDQAHPPPLTSMIPMKLESHGSPRLSRDDVGPSILNTMTIPGPIPVDTTLYRTVPQILFTIPSQWVIDEYIPRCPTCGNQPVDDDFFLHVLFPAIQTSFPVTLTILESIDETCSTCRQCGNQDGGINQVRLDTIKHKLIFRS
jgi:hypothetical protein